MSISRLEVPHDDRAKVEAELDAALEAHDGELSRDLSSGEVSIARWAEGDPARAIVIADRWATRLRRWNLRRQVIEEAYAERRDDFMAPLDEWRAAQEEVIAREEAFATGLLRMYQQDFHPGEKTTKLPHGQLKRRANRDRREWVDEDAALRWQEATAPEDVTRRLNKTALLERLKASGGEYFDAETGEVVEFLRDVPPEEPESFAVVTEGAE